MLPIEPPGHGAPPPPPPPPPPPTVPPGWGPITGAQPLPATGWLPDTDPPGAPAGDGPLPALPAAVRSTRWGLGDVISGFGLWLLSQLVLGAVVAAFLLSEGETSTDPDDIDLPLWALAITLAGNYAAFIGWPWLVAKWKGLGSLVRDFGLRFAWIDVALGVAAGITCLVISIVGNVIWAIVSGGDSAPSNATFLEDMPKDVGTFLALFTLIAILTPLAEEIFFRGLVLRSCAKRWGVWASIAVSSILFGLPHALASLDPVAMVFFACVTALYGSILALVCVYRDWTLGAPIVAHVVINGVGVSTLFLFS